MAQLCRALLPGDGEVIFARLTWPVVAPEAVAETMAQHAASFLAGNRPSRKILVVAGLAHCARPAIPQRIERRSAARTASVLPSVGVPADAQLFDYALVMTPGE